jgi:hypothetical protein
VGLNDVVPALGGVVVVFDCVGSYFFDEHVSNIPRPKDNATPTFVCLNSR